MLFLSLKFLMFSLVSGFIGWYVDLPFAMAFMAKVNFYIWLVVFLISVGLGFFAPEGNRCRFNEVDDFL